MQTSRHTTKEKRLSRLDEDDGQHHFDTQIEVVDIEAKSEEDKNTQVIAAHDEESKDTFDLPKTAHIESQSNEEPSHETGIKPEVMREIVKQAAEFVRTSPNDLKAQDAIENSMIDCVKVINQETLVNQHSEEL